MATRQELVAAVHERYRSSSAAERRGILDEFVAVSGYHRKHAIRLLNAEQVDLRAPPMGRTRIYGEAVRQALVILWEAADRICGKRLKVLIPVLLDAMARHGHLRPDREVQAQLLCMSAATIDRALQSTRVTAKGKRRRPAAGAVLVRKLVTVRTFNDWSDPKPGYFEADLVQHCGGRSEGSFVHSFVLTDIASGWTECVALVVREQSLVIEAIEALQLRLPVPLIGLDTDNDSVFMNQSLISYCGRHGIEQTRSRAYRKNDQAWIEQKNGAVVRKLVGYGRLEGLEAAQALGRLYEASRLYVNFFQPSMKLKSKTRTGAKVAKLYHPPATPCDRLLASNRVPEHAKEKLRAQFVALDPIALLQAIREAQAMLSALTNRSSASQKSAVQSTSLGLFVASLGSAWRAGEARATHRGKVRAARTWRTRKDPFESAWPMLLEWIEADPSLTAKALFKRLQSVSPAGFPEYQLRTLQRRVKIWRSGKAHELLFVTGREHNTLPREEATIE